MISTESLNLRGDEIRRNTKSSEEIEIEKIKLFGEDDNQFVKIGKNLSAIFKQRLIELLKKYH